MQVPRDRSGQKSGLCCRLRSVTVALLCGVVLWPVTASAGEPKPVVWVQLKLESLGFPGFSRSFLDVGYSMLTVHFLDDSHLLVTYSLRKLVPRIKDDPETHDDRLVAGEVVDIPSGKVVAKTEWHMHDHGRYLWTLGRGRFLIRIGDRFYTMAPLAGLGGAQPFERTLFPSQRQPRSVDVSDDGDVVTLETVVVQSDPNGARTIMMGDQDTATGEPTMTKTLIDFYRVTGDGAKEGPVVAEVAGHVVSQGLLRLPVDANGLLWASQSGNGLWAINFDGFGGKTAPLGQIESSCQPRLQMVSRSEFLAVTCRGAEDRLKLGSYGFDGKETWEESVGDFGQPVFAFAPAAGRFGVSHIIEPAAVSNAPVNGPVEEPRQEVRIYQNASGDQLLHVECSPIIKTAENFDLSADGLLAAVVRNGAIVVYRLPKPTKLDIQDMAEVDKFAPPVATGAITLLRLTGPPSAAQQRRAQTPVATVSEGQTEEAPAAAPEAGMATVPEPVAPPRKPPSLLKAGEKPEFGTANEQPKPQ
jgi:hypothetical protein